MDVLFNAIEEAGWVLIYDFTSLTGFPDRVYKSTGKSDDLAPIYLRIDRPTISSAIRVRFQPFLYWEEGIVDLTVARADASKREYTKFVNASYYDFASSNWSGLTPQRWMLVYASEELIRVYADSSLGFATGMTGVANTNWGVYAYRRLPGIAKTSLTPVSGSGGIIGDWYIAEDLRYFKQNKMAILRDGVRYQHIVDATILAMEYTDELGTGYSGRIQLNIGFTPPVSGQLLLERGYTGWCVLPAYSHTDLYYSFYAYLHDLEHFRPVRGWSHINSNTQQMTFLIPAYQTLFESSCQERLIGTTDVMAAPSNAIIGSIICVAGFGQEAISRRSATAGSALSLTDSSRAWSTNEHKDKICVITDGTGANQSRVIIGNTATVLQFRSPWIIAPNSTSIYRIVEQAWRVAGDGHCYKETF
jgi:hypothetical protein